LSADAFKVMKGRPELPSDAPLLPQNQALSMHLNIVLDKGQHILQPAATSTETSH